MEARVKHLEDDVSEIKSDMKSMRSDMTDIKVILARIESELSHKVSYTWMAIFFIGIASLILREQIMEAIG